MQGLDDDTEVFDLFGETGFCTICQEDLIEGERVRVIRACSHMYHQACIDPWLQEKGDCALCRTQVVPQTLEHSLERFRTIYSAIRQIPAGSIAIQDLMRQLESLIELTADEPNDTDRYIVSFCITDCILKKFTKAADYTARRAEIEEVVAAISIGVQPFPIDYTTHYAFFRCKQAFKHEMCTRLNIRTRGEIRGNSRITRIRDLLHAHQRLQAIIQP
jgi:hypothetical protein